MSKQNTFHCIVDDTALTTNLDEIGPWVHSGTVILVVPLHTLKRLQILQSDISQLGQNARKALKFLDQTADLPHNPVVIQGPEDQYKTWSEVEKRYTESVIQKDKPDAPPDIDFSTNNLVNGRPSKDETASLDKPSNDLSLTSDDFKTSPISTPPLSPSASEPQSAKTSPEARCVSVTKHDATPVPLMLQPLINYVVWYVYESEADARREDLVFLTNSADAAQIAKDFGVMPKTIHQLRASLPANLEMPANNNASKAKKKCAGRSLSIKDDSEPQTLFRYDEASSEDEELVFQPRTRDQSRPGSAGRGNPTNGFRGRGAMHSPSNSLNANNNTVKPQVPVEEIDPDSFDRGTFARGSTPLANVGNHYGTANNTFTRGQRNFSSPTQRGGGFRGNTLRGRGRGRLFVP